MQYERLDPDRDRAEDQAELIVYGLNLRIAGALFLKAEINSQHSGKANSRFKGVDFNEFKGAIVVGF